MKQLFLSLVVLFSAILVKAQTIPRKEVPSAVIYSFQKAHSIHDDAEWTKEGNDYVVEYNADKGDMYDMYNKEGKLLAKKEKMADISEPSSIMKYINEHYKKEDLQKVLKVTTIKGKVSYEAFVKSVRLNFNSKGAFVSTTKNNS
jgi:hypothetical protein